MKIITVVGARPQFVKAAVLSRLIRDNHSIDEVIIHTGQHFDSKMSDIFFEEMDIPKPHFTLDINSLSHGAMTGRMLEGIEKILLEQKPDMVLVYGDTNTTLAGALAAKKIHIPVAHIEAGLRSFNMQMPEEINRILTDRISDYLFCPTSTAINNLEHEGFKYFNVNIIKTGDIMFDAALYYGAISKNKSKIISELELHDKSFVLSTIHRQENTDDPIKLKNIFRALDYIHAINPVIIPLHPRTKKLMQLHGISTNCVIIDPVGYFDILELIKHCTLVVTDSGGLQKEAYYFLKNSIILRDQTEWLELTNNHVSMLAGCEYENIIKSFQSMISKPKPQINKDWFGDGNSANIILQSLINS